MGKQFTLVTVAEGARPAGGAFVTAGEAGSDREARLGGVGHIVASEIEKRTGKETRAVVLGHLQRGGAPTAWDRQLCTRFGWYAVELIAEARYGTMVALTHDGIESVPLTDAIDRIRTVPPDGELVRMGRALGISFGNE
jgi:6-phosphofructokinase 1